MMLMPYLLFIVLLPLLIALGTTAAVAAEVLEGGTDIEREVQFSFEAVALMGSGDERPVQHLDEEHRDNIQSFIDLDEVIAAKSHTEQLAYLNERCETALQAFGYYWARCKSRITKQRSTLDRLLNKTFEIAFHVDLGRPVTVRQWQVELLGDAAQSPEILAYIDDQPLKPGQPFRHDHYENLKQGLQDLSAELGLFDAQFVEQSVNVSLAEMSADVTLVFQGGLRYRFGDLHIEGAKIDRGLIESLRTFKAGSPYHALALVDYNNKLLQTQYFSHVRVIPDVENAESKSPEDKRVPIVLLLTMKPKNTVRFGMGYSTDVGARGRVEWVKPWISRRGRRIAVKTELSAVVQRVDVRFKTPVLGAVQRQFEQSIGWERHDVEARETVSAALTYRMPLTRGWHFSPSVRIEQEQYTDLNVEQKATSLIPGFEIWRRRKRGGLAPIWGDFIRVGMEVGSEALAAEEDFYRITLMGKLIRQPFERQRILLGLNLGSLITDAEVTALPDSLRFLAGGDQSIRGFDYKEIGGEISEGATATGTESALHLATLSVEYDWAFVDRWRAALFVDAGDAFNEDFDLHVGAGLGLRWMSPVGPIKLDGGYTLSEEPKVFRLHFSMGLDI